MSTIVPVESFPRVVRSELMELDCASGTPDGVLTRSELERHIDRLHDKYDRLASRGEASPTLSIDIRDCERILEDMVAHGADGVDYLPQSIRDADLPANLKLRAVEILAVDGKGTADNLNRTLLSKAKRRLTGSGRTVGTLRGQAEGLKEIDQLAKALGLN